MVARSYSLWNYPRASAIRQVSPPEVTGPGGSVSYSINGGRTEYNNWEIDGGDVMDSGSMSNLNVFPNVDALDQVQVFTSSYDAQYGRSGSGAVEAVTKSGTNKFHGEAFEFLRNQLFNAKNYFNEPGERIGAYKKHDFRRHDWWALSSRTSCSSFIQKSSGARMYPDSITPPFPRMLKGQATSVLFAQLQEQFSFVHQLSIRTVQLTLMILPEAAA